MFVCVLESWGSWGTFWQSAGKKGLFSGFRRGKGGGRGLLRDLDRFASEQNGQPLVMTSGWGARIGLVDKIKNCHLSVFSSKKSLGNFLKRVHMQCFLFVRGSSWPEFVQIKLGIAHLFISKYLVSVHNTPGTWSYPSPRLVCQRSALRPITSTGNHSH